MGLVHIIILSSQIQFLQVKVSQNLINSIFQISLSQPIFSCDGHCHACLLVCLSSSFPFIVFGVWVFLRVSEKSLKMIEGSFKEILRVFQGNLEDVKNMFVMIKNEVSKLFRASCMDVCEMSQGCGKSVLKVLSGNIKKVLRLFQGNLKAFKCFFRKALCVILECFKEVLRVF